MVKIQLILYFVLLLHPQFSEGVSTGMVIVNNKQMKYNEKGELVEFIKVKKHTNEKDKPLKLVKFGKPIKVEEKSNFFKDSDFVTNHNFKTNIVTKHDLNQNWNYAEPVTTQMEHKWNNPPSNTETNNYFNQLVQSNLNKKPTNINMNNWNDQNPAMENLLNQFIQNNINKRKPLSKQKPMRNSTPRPVSHYQTLKYQSSSSIVSTTPFSPTTLDDEITSQENSLNSTYEDIYKYEYMKYPELEPEPLQGETNRDPQVVIIYASPSPPPPDVSIHLPLRKKTKTKKKMKTTPKPAPDHKEFLQNVEYFKKNLMFNCSLADETMHNNLNAYMSMPTTNPIISITPKPKDTQEDKNDEKTIIIKKKVKKKGGGHGGGGHGGHGGGGHGGHGGGGHNKKKHDKEITVYVKPVELNHGYSDDGGGHGGHHQSYGGHHQSYGGGHKEKHDESESEDDHSDDSEESKGNDHSDADPSVEHFSEAGGIWDSFYNYMEGSFTSKEIVESHHRKKKGAILPMQNKNQKRQTLNTVTSTKARKSVVTNVHVVTDLGNSLEATTPMTLPVEIIKKPSQSSSEEDEEEYPTFYDQVMGLRDDEDDELDDEELYDDDDYENIQINRLPNSKEDRRNETNEEYSDEDEEEIDYSNVEKDKNPPAPSFGFMDTFSTAFSKFGSFLSSFTGYRDSLDYEDEGRRTTTPRIEPQSKRPKRQQQPWYFPMFVNDPEQDENEVMTGPLDSYSPTSSSWFEPPWTWFEKPSTQVTPTTSTTPNPVSPFLPPPNNLMNIWSQILPDVTTESTIVPQDRLLRKSYKNYQLWRLYPKTNQDVEHIEEYRVSPAGLKFQWWQGTTIKGITDVLVPPKHDEFKEHIEDGSIKYEIINRDIQTAIHFENPRLNKREQIELEIYNGHPMTWYRYHRYAEIRKYLEFLQRKYNKYVELEHIGYSFEGRPLTIVKVSYPTSSQNESKQRMKNTTKKVSNDKKPAVFIESGANAREWLPVASSTYILNTIVQNIRNNNTLGKLVRSVDWYFMVLLNPDGYEYSFNYDRLWQKTRSKHPDVPTGFLTSALTWLQPISIRSSENICYGTHANRNFDYLWNEFGTSNYKCSDNYGGPYVESEPETKLFSNFLMSYKKQIKLFISLHSYGQKISYPISGVAKEDLEELEDIARAGITNLKNSRFSPAKFTVDPMNEMSYRQSGTSAQFAMHRAQIKHSFTIELRDSGMHGFLVPASLIEDSSLELFEIIKGMIYQSI